MSYQVSVFVNVTDITDAVLGGLNITLGRSELTQRVAQNSASFRLSRTKLEEVLEAGVGTPPDRTVFIGADVFIVEQSLEREIFHGRITDLSSDALTLSVSAVDQWTFAAVACDPFDYPLATKTATEHAQDIAGGAGLSITSLDVDGPEITFGDLENVTNIIGPLQQILTSTETGWVIYSPPTDTVVMRTLAYRENTIGIPPYVLTSGQIKKAYSIKKSVADITNRVFITDASNTTQIVSNATNVIQIGPRVEQLNTGLTSSTVAFDRALFELGIKSPANWSLLQAETDANRLGSVADVTTLLPNTLVNCSDVDAFGFADTMYVEQVGWSISEKEWVVRLLLSNAAHTGPLQTWDDVDASSPTLTWAEVNTFYTWDDLLYTDL